MAKIILSGKTIPQMAKDLNLAKTTIYRKVKGKTEFNRKEIENIIVYLNLTDIEAMEIFFS